MLFDGMASKKIDQVIPGRRSRGEVHHWKAQTFRKHETDNDDDKDDCNGGDDEDD